MSFTYTAAAIPTMYKGIQMRSRLEARWAAFFDLLGWEWEYEPLDMNGWIPDFMLKGKTNRILCEVKPGESCDQDTYDKVALAVKGTPWEAERPYPHRPPDPYVLLFLGQSPYRAVGDFMQSAGLGWFYPKYEAAFIETPQGFIDFHDPIGDYRYLITEGHPFWHHPKYYGFVPYSRIQPLWNQAGNKTQWNPPQASR